jgi:hypothetical protein
MCEHCGCQALDAIAVLTAEHEAVVNLLAEHREIEDGAFPAPLGSLDPADWEAVDAVRARVGRCDLPVPSETR